MSHLRKDLTEMVLWSPVTANPLPESRFPALSMAPSRSGKKKRTRARSPFAHAMTVFVYLRVTSHFAPWYREGLLHRPNSLHRPDGPHDRTQLSAKHRIIANRMLQ